MTKRTQLAFLLIAVYGLFLASCGGGGSSAPGAVQPPGINVQITMPSGGVSLDQAQSMTAVAAVNNDSGSAGVTWTLTAQNSKDPLGTLSNPTKTQVMYTAPAGVTKQIQNTLTATSVTDPARFATLPITVNPSPIITTTQAQLLPAVVKTTYSGFVNVSGGAAPYSWNITAGSLPTGLSLQPGNTNSVVIGGTPTVTGIFPFTIEATDLAGSKASADFSLSVAPGSLKIQVPTILGGITGVPYVPPLVLTATGGAPPLTWGLQVGSFPLPPGLTLGTDGVISGTPTAAGSYTFIVQAEDTQLPVPAFGVKSVTININLPDLTCGTGGSPISQGPFAFMLTGFDANGPVTIAGSFTDDGLGNITGGVEDVIRSNSTQTNLSIVAAGSTYSVGPDNRGCLTLVDSNGGTTAYRFALGGFDGTNFTTGRIIEFDDTTGTGTRASGMLRLQDPSSFTDLAFNGPYAFGLRGWSPAGGHFALAGSTTASAGILSSVAADVDDSGVVSAALTGGTGTYSISSNGRGLATLTVGSVSLDAAVYMVNSHDILLLSLNKPSTGHLQVTGEALTSTGVYSIHTLGTTHMFAASGAAAGGPAASVGLWVFDGFGNFSGTNFENAAGIATTEAILGQYAVDGTTGRAVLSGPNAGITPPVFYLTGAATGVTGFLVGTDSAASDGRVQFQTDILPPLFNTGFLRGPYIFGPDQVLDATTTDVSGFVIPGGTGSFSGIQDTSASTGLTTNQTLGGSYTVNLDGTGTFGGNTFAITNGPIDYYLGVSPLDTRPALIVVQQ